MVSRDRGNRVWSIADRSNGRATSAPRRPTTDGSRPTQRNRWARLFGFSSDADREAPTRIADRLTRARTATAHRLGEPDDAQTHHMSVRRVRADSSSPTWPSSHRGTGGVGDGVFTGEGMGSGAEFDTPTSDRDVSRTGAPPHRARPTASIGEIVARARGTGAPDRTVPTLEAARTGEQASIRGQRIDATRVAATIRKYGREPRHLLVLRRSVAWGSRAQIERTVGPLASIDMTVLGVACFLVSVGLIVLQSASSVTSYAATRDSSYYLVKQFFMLLLGVVSAIIVTVLDYHRVAALWKYGLIGCVVVLTVVFTGLGLSANGAQRWIGLFGFQLFQPGELIKPVLIVAVAGYLTRETGVAARFRKGLLPFSALYAVVLGLLMLQPDMGTAVVVGVTGGVILIVSGARILHLALLGGAAVAAFAGLVIVAPYRLARWITFLDPWANSQGSGYHVVQSLLALGSGGITGVGLGMSRQKFFYLPFPHTDSIFAVLGEELGFVGTVATLSLFLLFMWRGLGVAKRAPDVLGRCIAAGATMGIVGQAVINIAVLTSSVPFTGITLPFFSYGGSSMVASCVMCGLILSVSRHIPHEASSTAWWARWRTLRHAATE